MVMNRVVGGEGAKRVKDGEQGRERGGGGGGGGREEVVEW